MGTQAIVVDHRPRCHQQVSDRVEPGTRPDLEAVILQAFCIFYYLVMQVVEGVGAVAAVCTAHLISVVNNNAVKHLPPFLHLFTTSRF